MITPTYVDNIISYKSNWNSDLKLMNIKKYELKKKNLIF